MESNINDVPCPMLVQCGMKEICAEEEERIQQTDPKAQVVVLDWGNDTMGVARVVPISNTQC